MKHLHTLLHIFCVLFVFSCGLALILCNFLSDKLTPVSLLMGAAMMAVGSFMVLQTQRDAEKGHL